MYISSIKNKKIFLIILIVLLAYACSPKRLTYHEKITPASLSKTKLLKKLKQKGCFINSISATAFVQVTYNGKTLPWIRCRLYWSKIQNRVVVRIIGMGFFGQKIFDFLAGVQAIYLYIPSKAKVFSSSYSEAAIMLGLDPFLLGQELKWVLDPYSLINKKPQKLYTNKIYAWLKVDIGNFKYATEKIDLFDISIKNLSLPQLKVYYQNYAYFASNAYYPQRIIISSKIRPLTIKINLTSILVNNISATSPVFNETPFLKLPCAPLALLFMNIT